MKYRIVVADGYSTYVKSYHTTLKAAKDKIERLPEGDYSAYIEKQSGKMISNFNPKTGYYGTRYEWIEV